MTQIAKDNQPVSAIRPRDRDQLFQALRAGVVPRTGIRHVQVGRAREIQEIARDLDRIADGGTAFRIIVGTYGAGKTFFLNLSRAAAQEKRLVTMTADLSPEKRLHSTSGQARTLLAELAKSMATRTKPEGNALESILQRLIMEVRQSGNDFKAGLEARLEPILDLAGGYDAVQVIRHYAAADEAGDHAAKESVLRWLRAEFATKTEARGLLPVRDIPDDGRFWDHLKIIAALVRAAGFAGLLVSVDECVNLYKIQSSQSRNANYEEILRILNDLLQGSTGGIGLMLGGTPEFLMDGRRGLHSYEALRSRLAENTFQASGMVDLSGPVIRLQNLSPEDMWVLLTRLRAAWFSDPSLTMELPDSALEAFTEHCQSRIGAAWFQTPRATIRAFVDLLEILRQNPEAAWNDLLKSVNVRPDSGIDDHRDTAGESASSSRSGQGGTAPAFATEEGRGGVEVAEVVNILDLRKSDQPSADRKKPAPESADQIPGNPVSGNGEPGNGAGSDAGKRDDDLAFFKL